MTRVEEVEAAADLGDLVGPDQLTRVLLAVAEGDLPLLGLQEIAGLGDKISQLDEQLRQVEADSYEKQLYVPNMPGPGVPVGPDEHHNVEVRRWGEPPNFDFAPKPHWELGEALGIIDFERGIKISGTRFYLFKGAGAALHRAFPWVDAVVRGEGERVFPGLVKDFLAGGPCRPQPGLCYRDGELSGLNERLRTKTERFNGHPTVKPTELMRHLVRLVTPPGGTVLDPFLGSGTTALAAEMEGFEWIGIEKEAEYVAIAEARLNGTQRGMGLVG